MSKCNLKETSAKVPPTRAMSRAPSHPGQSSQIQPCPIDSSSPGQYKTSSGGTVFPDPVTTACLFH